MDEKQLLKRLLLIKKNPKLADLLPQGEILEYIQQMMVAFSTLKKAIEENKIKGEPGYSPQAGKDYHSRKEIQQYLGAEVSNYEAKTNKLLQAVETRLETIKDGQDAEITEEIKEEIAEMCVSLLSLPDFDQLTRDTITANPTATRDALELITEENEKLEQSAVKNLVSDLDKLKQEILHKVSSQGGTIGKGQVYGFIRQAVADGTIPAGGSGSTISVDGAEVADPDFTDAGDIDFNASGSTVTGSIKDDTVGLDELSATGTPSASTYLRGDNTWAAVSGATPLALFKDGDGYPTSLTGAKDGVNTTYTVDQGEYETGTLSVFKNGQKMTFGVDVNETTPASGTFDFTVAPLSTDQITIEYLTAPADRVRDWWHYIGAVFYNGTETAITGGDVLEAVYDSTTVYRYITTAVDANGYPTEDAFYSTFDGTTLSGKLVERGIIV